jgi:two-component system CheB/CheR fusion protein
MKNLLNSTDIATLFLDGNLLVRRFTSPTAHLIKLIPSDVGRPITDIARNIDYPELTDDVHEVIRTLVFREKIVAGPGKRWFAVRIMPYRTLENVIDGVVITFTDASARKTAEGALNRQTGEFSDFRQQASEFRQLAESLPNLVLGCRADGACEYVGNQWLEYTGLPDTELLGEGWLDTIHDEDRDGVRGLWSDAVKSGHPADLEFRVRGKDGTYRWFRSRSAPIRDEQGQIVRWYAMISDIHDLKQAAAQNRLDADRLAAILDCVADPFFVLTADHTISHANLAAKKMLGSEQAEVLNKNFFQIFPASAGAPLREAFQKVVRSKREGTFEMDLDLDAFKGKFVARLFPTGDGIGALFQRQERNP